MRKVAILSITLTALGINTAAGAVSSNVPIMEYKREYDILERAKEIGLVKNVDLSFKPLTREDFARGIIEIYNNRKKNPQLAKKFFNELYPYFKDAVNDLIKSHNINYIKPIVNAFEELSYSNVSKYKFPYEEGFKADQKLNYRLRISSELKYENFLAYIEPEIINQNTKLNRWYLTSNFKGWNLEIGRDTVWYGNSNFGDLLVTNNISPWLMLKIEEEKYQSFPGIFKKLGEFRFSTFLSRLEKDRVRSYAKVWGMRFSWRPLENLEIAGTRAIQFGGAGRPDYNSLKDIWHLFKADEENVRSSSSDAHYYDNNQLASIDITWYLDFLDNWKFQPFKGGKLYFVYAGDDAVKPTGPLNLPLPTAAAHIFELDLTTGWETLKFNYTETIDDEAIWYTHHMYPNGYTYKGFIVGNALGGDSKSYTVSFSKDFTSDLSGNISFSYEKHGVKAHPFDEKIKKFSIGAIKQLTYKKTNIRVYSTLEYDNANNFNCINGLDKDIYLFSLKINLNF